MRTDELRDQVLITHNGLLITSLTVLDLALQDSDSFSAFPPKS
jgi:hypothetical protein